MEQAKEGFTKYEIARIIGARALQIAMDAPILLKITPKELEEMKYDSLRISEKEFKEGVLPIAIHRPTPRKGKDKLAIVKEEHVSDEELIEKEKEVEKEIIENAEEYGLSGEDEEVAEPTTNSEESQ